MKIQMNVLALMLGTLFGAASLNAYAGAEDVQTNLSKLKVPPGFKIEVYADVPGARQMALGTNGNVYVGTRGNKVYAVVDKTKITKRTK